MHTSRNKCQNMGSFLFRSQGSFLIPWRSSAASHLAQPPDLFPESAHQQGSITAALTLMLWSAGKRDFAMGLIQYLFFFFLISVEDGDLRRGIKDLVEGNQPWQRHIAHFYFCARALCWTLCCAPSWTWKPKSRCSEGLAKPWSELYFSWWDFPRSEPRLIGSKEKISQLLPTGLTLRGTEDFCPQC